MFACYRKENSSHHQEWNSDEDKVPHHSHTPAIMNSYTTALALNSHSDLPPSPMSPMTSTMGIDPKWEFPRENITLQDELAVGQFTVLYKATAKGISRDNRLCEVTVKSLIGKGSSFSTAGGEKRAVPGSQDLKVVYVEELV